MSDRNKFYQLVGHTAEEVEQADWDAVVPVLNILPVDRIGAYLGIPDWKVAIVEYEILNPSTEPLPF